MNAVMKSIFHKCGLGQRSTGNGIGEEDDVATTLAAAHHAHELAAQFSDLP